MQTKPEVVLEIMSECEKPSKIYFFRFSEVEFVSNFFETAYAESLKLLCYTAKKSLCVNKVAYCKTDLNPQSVYIKIDAYLL